MDILGKLLGKKQAESRSRRIIRIPKPLSVNLGEVPDAMLEVVVQTGTPLSLASMQGVTRDPRVEDITITPELARRALEAKKREHLADSLTRSHRYQEAAREYLAAIEMAPYEDEILYMSMGATLYKLGRVDESLSYLQTAHEINPHNQRVLRNLEAARVSARGKS